MAAVFSSATPARHGLLFERRAVAVAPSAHTPLAQRVLGLHERDDVSSPPLLHPAHEVVESWLVDAPVHSAVDGGICYSTDGKLLFGSVTIDESLIDGGLTAATAQVYTALFDLLKRSGCPHLLRAWNYMARINEPSNGLERYRQFNIGRQQAFLAAGRSAFAGSPAACALGSLRGPLTVHFLAGQCEPRAVENPRQVSAYHYPAEYGPRTPTFSRGALADVGGSAEALFISGTASIVGHASLHVGDVRRQTEETLANIDALVGSAVKQSALPQGDEHRTDRLDCTVYVRHAADLDAVRQTFERCVGPQSIAARHAVYLRADICRNDLLVEVEAHRIGGLAH